MKKQTKMNMNCRLTITVGLSAATLVGGGLLSGCSLNSNNQAVESADPISKLREANVLADQAQQAEIEADDMKRRGESAEKIRVKQDQALALYQRSVATYRDFAPAWNNMGSIFMEQGRGMEAKEAFLMAADLAPSDPKPMSNLGLLWEKLQYADEANRAYEAALARNPNYLPALRKSVMLDVTYDRVTPTTAERVQKAMLLETDPLWKTALSRAKSFIDERLSNSREMFAR